MFHQFFQRDKADAIVLDVDVLSALAAGLVRCFHIDGFNQFSKHIRVDFLDTYILFCLRNELFNVFNLSFLYFDFLSQSDNLCFKLFLFRFVALAHHIKAFIT